MEHSVSSGAHSISREHTFALFAVEHTAFPVEHTVFAVEHTVFPVEHTVFAVEHTSFPVEYSISSARSVIFFLYCSFVFYIRFFFFFLVCKWERIYDKIRFM